MMKQLSIIVFAVYIIAHSLPAFSGESKRPDTAVFDGTNSVSLPGHFALDVVASGTIEFFVAAKWRGKAPHDPVIFSALTPKGPRYAVAITGDKQAIGLAREEDWDMTEFDFSDGKMHHVAFVVMNGVTDVYIDYEHEDTLLTGFGSEDVTSFHLGSLNGAVAPFKGALANLRIWDTPLDPDDMKRFARLDIFSPKGLTHPDIDALVAVGQFAKKPPTLILVEADPRTLGPDAERIVVTPDDLVAVEPILDVDLAAAAEFDAENPEFKDEENVAEIFQKALEETDGTN